MAFIGTTVNFEISLEQGIWNEIFGPCDRASSAVVPKLFRPKVVPLPDSAPVLPPVEKSRRLEPVPQSWQQVVMASDVATWQEMHDAKLDTALKRWFDVVIMFPTSFQLVFQLAALTSVAEQMTMMRDVIGSRSPLTASEEGQFNHKIHDLLAFKEYHGAWC